MENMENLLNILLVEDNPDDYEAASRSFRKSRFMNPIQWCKSGADALDYLYKKGKYQNDNNATPDLILLDLNMPGIDGREVLRTLKNDPEKRSIPVIVLTTSSDNKDIDKCYEIGASTYIQKPVSFDGLTEAIQTMTDYWFGVAILPSKKDDD